MWHAQEDMTVVTITRLLKNEDKRVPKADLVADGDWAMAKIPEWRPSNLSTGTQSLQNTI